MSQSISHHGIKLKDLCDRLAVDYDAARYTLARGILPKGVQGGPGRGNHRLFNHAQAFHLAVVLKLKAAGITTTVAGRISEWSRHVQGISCNRGWDPRFAPFAGKLQTDRQWFLEVGDAQYARIVTDANPSKTGLDHAPWVDMLVRRERPDARPAVIFRVDIALIAHCLVGVSSP